MQTLRWATVASLTVAGVLTARADNLAIQSFDGSGKLTFNEIPAAATYRVEWASSPAGPWTNFTAAALAMDNILAKGSGIVTCSVPVFYRVVAKLPDVPTDMAQISAGTNSGTNPLGTNESYSDAYPANYSLTVETFFMDQYKVSKAKWDEVYNWAVTNGYAFSSPGVGKAANHPVLMVNGYDCIKWCNARSQRDGRTPCYTVGGSVYKTGQTSPDCNFAANGFRLPTDTEWEYAARGGLVSKRFPWGDTITPSQANYYSNASISYDTSPTRGYHPAYKDDSDTYTSPVGAFAANGFGLYDMSGNADDWCWDGPGSSWSIRGGSFAHTANAASCGMRPAVVYTIQPENMGNACGFRTVFR
jgi:formylglycine-generating enzyme required for sulfatase activity